MKEKYMNEREVNDAVLEIRGDISKVLDKLKALPQSRHSSLTATKLEEAQMWAGNMFSKDKTDCIIKRD